MIFLIVQKKKERKIVPCWRIG